MEIQQDSIQIQSTVNGSAARELEPGSSAPSRTTVSSGGDKSCAGLGGDSRVDAPPTTDDEESMKAGSFAVDNGTMPSSAAHQYLNDVRRMYVERCGRAWPPPATKPVTRVSVTTKEHGEVLRLGPRGEQDILHVVKYFRIQDFGRRQRDDTAVIVENVTGDWIGALGAEFDISPEFFIMHASNAPTTGTEAGFEESNRHWVPRSYDNSEGASMNVSANFHFRDTRRIAKEEIDHRRNFFPREAFINPGHPTFSNTKLSYSMLRPGLALFLVDAPPEAPRGQISLRSPSDNSTGGIILVPSLNRRDPFPNKPRYDLFVALVHLFQYDWHWRLFHGNNDAFELVPVQRLLYSLVCSSIRTNLDRLEIILGHIILETARQTIDDDITARLHTLQEYFVCLKADTQELLNSMPASIDRFCDKTFPQGDQVDGSDSLKYWPSKRLRVFSTRITELESSLTSRFMLLFSIREARETRKQNALSIELARRATLVTVLAFIFIPMTLVAGIFGMNVNGNGNDSNVEWWWVLVALGIVMGLTLSVIVCINGPARSWRTLRRGCRAVLNTWKEDLRTRRPGDTGGDGEPLLDDLNAV